MTLKKIYLNLFKYLREFSKIREIQVLDIEFNDSVFLDKLWLDEIPKDNLISNLINKNFNIDNEYWLKVSKPLEPIHPSFPKISKNLEIWILENSLQNKELGPILKECIDFEGNQLSINDYPNITNEFINYKNNLNLNLLNSYNFFIFKKLK